MIPLPIQPKKLIGGQQDQGHEVVLHDQGEGYRQPIGPKFNILVNKTKYFRLRWSDKVGTERPPRLT